MEEYLLKEREESESKESNKEEKNKEEEEKTEEAMIECLSGVMMRECPLEEVLKGRLVEILRICSTQSFHNQRLHLASLSYQSLFSLCSIPQHISLQQYG